MKPFRFHSLPTYAEVASQLGTAGAVLDLGCSEGFFLGEIEDAALRVGVDRDPERLRRGKKDQPDIALVRADAAALPFAANVFPRVASIGLLPYLSDVNAVLAEASRVLAPAGRLVVTALSDYPLYRLLTIHWRRSGVRHLRRDRLGALIREAGLQIVSAYEKGRIIAPALAGFYSALSLVDRRLLRASSIVGPLGRWARAVTNPLIRWEYAALGGPGNTIYIVAEKR